MNYPDITRDPPRDRELAARLLAVEGEGREIRDAARLRAAILARAELPLARLRLQPFWWEYAARWARPAVPVALAASLALGYLIGTTPLPGAGVGAGAAASLPFLEEVLTSPVPQAEYDLLHSGEGDTEALLRFALQEL
jgi:hypothetical protein